MLNRCSRVYSSRSAHARHKNLRETEDDPVNHSEGLAFKQCERSRSLSFYQVLIEQRDQIAEYRNESRKRARHAIFTCFAPGANSACWSLSSHAQASSTAIFVLGSKRRPARKRFNRFALTLMDSLANVFNEWLNRDGRKGNSMV